LQLEVDAGCGIAVPEPCEQHEPADADERTVESVESDLHAHERHAGDVRSLLVGADRVCLPTESGEPEQERTCDEERAEEDAWDGKWPPRVKREAGEAEADWYRLLLRDDQSDSR